MSVGPSKFRARCRVRAIALALAATALFRPAIAAPTPAQLADAREKLATAYDNLAAVDQKVSRESFDPAAILETVGRDTAALTDWVKTNIAPLPYAGALKGPSGTLLDRGGSSLDRALLLAELLRQAGNDVRLAHAAAPAPAATKEAKAADPFAKAPAAASRGRVAKTADQIGPLLTFAPAASATPPADHWWVQWQDNGRWVDADLDNAPAPLKAEQTYRYNAPDKLELPEEHIHSVDYAVVIEQWAGGKLSESKVVQGTVRTAEHPGPVIHLKHIPIDKNAPKGPAADLEAARKAILAQHEWMPILDLPTGRVAKASFTDAGSVNATPDLSKAGAAKKLGGGMFGAMGGNVGGNESKSADNPDTLLTAEWLDVTVHVPGQAPRTLRRPLFDLIGPAARAAGVSAGLKLTDAQRLERGLTILGSVDSLPLGSDLTREFVLHTAYQTELNTRDVWLAALAEPDVTKRRQKYRSKIDTGSPLPWFAVARQTVSPVPGQTFLAEPNVVDTMFRLTIGADGQAHARRTVDVVANPVKAKNPADGQRVVMQQGIADTAAEATVLKDEARMSENTFSLFDAHPASAKLMAIKSAADLAAAKLALPADTISRLNQDLTDGYAVVLYDGPISYNGADRSGWWRVRPDTGECVGVMDTGYHQEETEYIEDTYIAGDADTLEGLTKGDNGFFWKRHARVVAEDLGLDPYDMNALNYVLDMQQSMLEMGVWM